MLEKTYKILFKTEDEQLDKMLSATCYELRCDQTTTSGLSEAFMTFSIKLRYEGSYMPEYMPKALVKLEKIQFQVVDLEEEPQMQMQQHVIANLKCVNQASGSNYTVHLHTKEEGKAKMMLNDKNRAHSFGTLSDMVQDILSENSFEVMEVEPTTEVPEFKVMRQPSISDYQFLVDEITPRAHSSSGSGFRFFTSDGKKAYWSTVGYNTGEKEAKPELLLRTAPERQMQWVADEGSCLHETVGFDMDKKAPVKSGKKGPDVMPSYGETDFPGDYPHHPCLLRHQAGSHRRRHAPPALRTLQRLPLRGSAARLQGVGRAALQPHRAQAP